MLCEKWKKLGDRVNGLIMSLGITIVYFLSNIRLYKYIESIAVVVYI